MIRKIHIGIMGVHPGWEQILSQIGLSWSRISCVSSISPPEQSCIITDQMLNREEIRILNNYLDKGGSVLDTHGHLIPQTPIKRRAHVIYPKPEDSLFGHIEKVQVHHKMLFHPTSDLLGGAIWFDPDPGRALAFTGLPVHLFAHIQSLGSTEFRSARLPAVAERTTCRSSGPYLEIILTVLKKLHISSGLPLVHTWWMPKAHKQAATFRIDSDYGTPDSVGSAAAPALEFDIPVTWFLHTQAHESWLTRFKSWEKHELSLHCYRHVEFKTREQYSADISHGVQLLKMHGVKPAGYAAPYGNWSKQLSEALSGFSFLYSSEFGYDYDSLPSISHDSRILQLPVHPISIGSFRRFKFTHEKIAAYFDELLNLKILQHQPLHLYHHPNDGHEEILRTIFRERNHDVTQWMTYKEWALWWKQRSSVSLTATFDTESNTIQVSGSGSIPVAVHLADNKFKIAAKTEIGLDGSRFSEYIHPGWLKLVGQRRFGKSLSAYTLRKDQLMTYLWRNRG